MIISAEQTWNLEAIYPDADAWEADFSRIRPLAEAFLAFRGRLSESAATLRKAIEALDDFERLGEKVYVYAHLRSDENTADNTNRARVDRVEARRHPAPAGTGVDQSGGSRNRFVAQRRLR